MKALQEAQERQEEQEATITLLQGDVDRLTAEAEVVTEVESLRNQLKKEKDKAKKLWSLSCKRANEQEEVIVQELEIEDFKSRLGEVTSRAGGSSPVDSRQDDCDSSHHSSSES